VAEREWDEEAMFAEYVNQGDTRSYARVAALYGCAKKTIHCISQRNHWMDRLAFIEAEARKESEKRLLEQRTEVHTRHLQLLRAIQQRGAQAIQEHRFDSLRDASKAITDSIKVERNVLGETDHRLDVTVQQVTRREMDAMMTKSLFDDLKDDGDEEEAG
jgi:hypothetical protein